MLITEIIKPMLNDEMFACRVGSDQYVVFFKNETRLEELSIKAQDIIDRIVEKKVEIVKMDRKKLFILYNIWYTDIN